MDELAPLRVAWLGTVDYQAGWQLQRDLARARRRDEIDDTLLLLEHPPVYTMGRTGEPAHLGNGVASLVASGAEYVDVDRGGSVTFHGPGQLVAYPIVKLAEVFPLAGDPTQGDISHYLRGLEEALIGVAAEWGIEAVQRPPYTGIWMRPRDTEQWHKLAAIGVKLAGGVTTHGIAFNVTTDLAWYQQIVPCGISDAGVTSLRELSGADPRVQDVAAVLAGHVALTFKRRVAAIDSRLAERVALPGAVAAKAD